MVNVSDDNEIADIFGHRCNSMLYLTFFQILIKLRAIGKSDDSPPPLFMFCVYVMRSKVDNGLYIGYTDDLERRLREHNSGLSRSTKYRAPFDLIYCEIYKAKRDAIARERKLKKFKNSYTELKNRLKDSLL